MPTFLVTVEHRVSYNVEVEADNDDKAMDMAVKEVEDALADGSFNSLDMDDENIEATDCEDIDNEDEADPPPKNDPGQF